MKIEIDYNGSYAICRVNGKYIHECDPLTRGQALSAFSCIEQHLRREAIKANLSKVRRDDVATPGT